MKLSRLECGKYSVALFTPDSGSADTLIYLHADERRAGEIARQLEGARLYLASIDGVDWDAQLSPWPAPRAFKGGADFSGLGCGIYKRAVAGYSMAGLFALYALFRTDVFSRAASVSGSLWYDGFLEYASSHSPAAVPEKVYLSLGDRESLARDKRLACVGERTCEMAGLLRARNVPVEYELNPGGHFNDTELRMAKAIRALVK